jgi:putative endonuclease
MPAAESKKQLGVRGEDLACAELERQGMQVLERNWRCRLGEIDIAHIDRATHHLPNNPLEP